MGFFFLFVCLTQANPIYYVSKAGPKFTSASVSAFLMLVTYSCAITGGSTNLFKESSQFTFCIHHVCSATLLVSCHSTQDPLYKVEVPPQTSWSFTLCIPCPLPNSLDKDGTCTRNSVQYPIHTRNKVSGMVAHAFHFSSDPWGSLPVNLGLAGELQTNERPCLKGGRQYS